MLPLALAAVLHATAAAAPAPAPADASIDVSRYPPVQQARYQLFRTKCSKCHPLSIAIGSGFGPGRWERYMKLMGRRPNSGISDAQAAEILAFLEYWSARRDR